MGERKRYPKLTGEFIAVLDVDDIWEPTKLENKSNFDDSEVGIVVSNTKILMNIDQKSSKKFDPPNWGFKTLLENYFISLETLL